MQQFAKCVSSFFNWVETSCFSIYLVMNFAIMSNLENYGLIKALIDSMYRINSAPEKQVLLKNQYPLSMINTVKKSSKFYK